MPNSKWLNLLEIAIVEEKFEEIDSLASSIPNFQTHDEAETAKALLQEAISLLKKRKDKTSKEMKIIEKNRAFVEQEDRVRFSLDI